MSRSLFKYKCRKQEDAGLVREILKIKDKRPYYGRRRVFADLRRKGYVVNEKRVRRLIKALDLLVVVRRKARNKFARNNVVTPIANEVNDVWSLDFVMDTLRDGRRFRCLTIIDNLSREVPGVYVSESMGNFAVVNYLERLKEKAKLPKYFILDNGSEFANTMFLEWCKRNEIGVHFIDPGKPVQNAFIESFNGKFRTEFLSRNRFRDLNQVRSQLDAWLKFYNEERPHSSLDYLTPKEFAETEKRMLVG